MARVGHTARGEFLAGCRDEAPLLLGVAPFGMIYGIAALAAGVPAWLAQLASAVVFAGAAQLVIVQMLTAGAGFVPIALTSGLLNLRHVLYSASMAEYVRHLPRRWRLLLELPYSSQGKLAQSKVDELVAAPRPTQVTPRKVDQVEGEWQLELDVPPDLAHFTGHFPQTPVLPGVVQIDWAQRLARELIAELPPRFCGMEVLKFQQLVRPGDRIQLSLRFDAERGKLYFAYRNGDAPCSSGRILLGAMQ